MLQVKTRNPNTAEGPNNMAYDFGIVSALEHEHAAANLIFKSTRIPVSGVNRPFSECVVEADSKSAHCVFALATKKRGINMAICVQEMIRQFNPPVIILTGIAAGVPNPAKPRDHVRLGDVVIADYVDKFDDREIYNGLPKHLESTPTPGSKLLSHTQYLLSRFIGQKEAPWYKHIQDGITANSLFVRPVDETDIFRLDASNHFGVHPPQRERLAGCPMPHLGRLGSSAALLKDAGFRNRLAKQYKLKAIEMEAGGVAEAAWEAGIQYFIVQGICDYGDRDKADMWQYYASLASAAFIRSLIESMLFESKEDKEREPPKEPSVHLSGQSGLNLIDFFQTKCCEYLSAQVDYTNKSFDETMGSRKYYVDPVILDDLKKPISLDKGKDEILGAKRRHFVISSNSGQGKTIFLQKYFIRNAESFIDKRQQILPFYFHLMDLRNVKEGKIIDFLIKEVFRKQFNGIDESDLHKSMETKLENGEILFLLDGFDQTQINANIQDLFPLSPGRGVFQKSRVVIASRPEAVHKRKNIFQGYKRLEIAPFNPRQITTYFDKLKVDKNKIKKVLQDFFEVLQIPILMYLLGQIAQGNALEEISQKSDVYRVFCRNIIEDNLVKFWHKHLENPSGSEPYLHAMMKQLQQIAYLGFEKGEILRISEDFVAEKIIEKVNGISNLRDVQTLCEFGIIYSIFDQGNFILRDTHFLEFKHQSFQAYFAALQLLEELKKEPLTLQNLLKKKMDKAWLEGFSFFAELPDAKDTDKRLIAKTLLGYYLKDQKDRLKDRLYEAAKVFSCLKDKDAGLREQIRDELVKMVELDIAEVVENEKPFQALRNLGESEYLVEYAANQEKYNSVNRFYAFKYALDALGRVNIAEFASAMNVLESTAKLDYIFALNRINSAAARKLTVKFYLRVFRAVGISNLIKSYAGFLMARGVYAVVYSKFIKPIREQTKYASFYVQGNGLYSFRDGLQGEPSGWLTKWLAEFESRLSGHINNNKDGKWTNYEDICMVVLGILANEELVSPFYDDFLNKEALTNEDLYKQAMAACALGVTFPGKYRKNQEMLGKVTERCIEIFKAGEKNPYRYYIAAALAFIGNQMVIKYFLDFIQRPAEKQRWFASMVLGCLDDKGELGMLKKLEELSNLPDDTKENKRTKYFASQALLVYSQTHMRASDEEDEDIGYE